MWQSWIVLAFLPIVCPEILDHFYGTWTPVAIFPVGSIPYCVEFKFYQDQRGIHCTCDDGKGATLVNIAMAKDSPQFDTNPFIDAATAEDVNILLNVSCKCGDKDYKSRAVVRRVSDNYSILYSNDHTTTYTVSEPNSAQLMVKQLLSSDELLKDFKNIPELSERKGGFICAKEVYDDYALKV